MTALDTSGDLGALEGLDDELTDDLENNLRMLEADTDNGTTPETPDKVDLDGSNEDLDALLSQLDTGDDETSGMMDMDDLGPSGDEDLDALLKQLESDGKKE